MTIAGCGWEFFRRSDRLPKPPETPVHSNFGNWSRRLENALPPVGAAEAERIRQRRQALNEGSKGASQIDGNAPVVGLTLSGGGIRSATFSLGILRQLAAEKIIHRIDYLSTVSGGSYIGSYYCGLFTGRGGDAPVVSAENFPDPFADRDGAARASLDWLRQSGRYLAPSGSGDYWYAVGVLVRNWIGLHIVIGSTLMLLSLIAVGFRLLMLGMIWPYFQLEPSTPLYWAPPLVLLALPVAVHFAGGWAYWLTRRDVAKHARRPNVAQTASVAIVVVSSVVAWRGRAELQDFGSPAFIALLIAGGAASGLARLTFSLVRIRGGADVETLWDRRRAYLTRPLGKSMIAFAVILAIAAADACGFWLYQELYTHPLRSFIGSPVVIALVVPAGRWLVPRLMAFSGSPTSGKIKPVLIGKGLLLKFGAIVAALILIVAVVSFWSVLAYKTSWPAICGPATKGEVIVACKQVPVRGSPAPPAAGRRAQPAPHSRHQAAPAGRIATGQPVRLTRRPWGIAGDKPPLDWRATWRTWGGWTCALLVYAICVGFSRAFLNLSGLTSFYADRLRRAYLGAGNRRRVKPGPADPQKQLGLDQWEDQDDIQLGDRAGNNYYPPGSVAPLHLINITLNETRGKASNIVQQDRHGRNLAITPEGICYTGDEGSTLVRIPFMGDPHEPLPLSTWVAISGAAFSTGLGGRTGFPITQLAGLGNIRLGYWWRRNWQADHSFAQSKLWREFRGDFTGPDQRYWYLTDGGHFENTGAYELLRRRVPLIIISDNGMDQHFEYEDVANLVRKARIDFGCEIQFLDEPDLREVLGHDEQLRRSFGTLIQIAGGGDPAPHAVAALARAEFDDGAQCTIIMIKPRLTGDGPADLVRYKGTNSTFPQQTTLDEFFDEAQWESYYYLGRAITQSVFRAPVTTGWYPSLLKPLPVRRVPGR